MRVSASLRGVMSSSHSLTTRDASQYELIEAAVRETERGRWFLEEYARRNRNADTEVLLGAIHRLESVVTEERGGDDVVRFRGDLMDMADAIARTRAEVAALSGPDHGESRLTVASEALDSIVRATERATSDILGAAEQVQEVAWTLRETGADGAVCDDLDRHATQIYTACSFQDLTAQRTSRIVHTLRYLEDRITSMIGIWGPEEAVPDLDTDPRIRRDTARTMEAALDQTDVDRFLDMDGPAAQAEPVRPPLTAITLHDDLAFLPETPVEAAGPVGEGAAIDPVAEAPTFETAADRDPQAPVVAPPADKAAAPVEPAPVIEPAPLVTLPAAILPAALAAGLATWEAAETPVAASREDAPAQSAVQGEIVAKEAVAKEAVAKAPLGDLFDVPVDAPAPGKPVAETAAPETAADEKAAGESTAAQPSVVVDDLADAFVNFDELSIEEKIALFA